MAEKKYTKEEIGRFDDRSANYLADLKCFQIFEKYLESEYDSAMLRSTLKLWKAANGDSKLWEEEAMQELMDDIDEFDEDCVLNITKLECKMNCIKQECCRIFDQKVKDNFIAYLKKHHNAETC